MTSRMPYRRFGALICLLAAQPVLAVDCDAPVTLGDKPSMDAYADYSDFLVAIMDYKTRERDLQAQQDACPELFISRVDPTSLDPTVTYGPETLESAVERSARIPAIDYSANRTWYNRSTSRSFGLPTLPSNQMTTSLVRTPLRTVVDGNVPERDQALVLNLVGPLPTADGASAQMLVERQFRDTLPVRDEEVIYAFSADQRDAVDDAYTIVNNSTGSSLTLYLRDTEIVYIKARGEGCMIGAC